MWSVLIKCLGYGLEMGREWNGKGMGVWVVRSLDMNKKMGKGMEGYGKDGMGFEVSMVWAGNG